jgi:hypothetical protein
LHEILNRLLAEAKTAGNQWELIINIAETRDGSPGRLWQMQASCGRGEDAETAITIMLPEEGTPQK